MPKRRTPNDLWKPVNFDETVAYALQAMAKGEAEDHQQKKVLDWIITEACQTYEEPFDPENARATDYILGRRSVGLAIVKHLTTSPSKIKELQG